MTTRKLPELIQSRPRLANLRGLALILTAELNTTLEEIQASLLPRKFVVKALPLSGGDYMLGADLLSEIGPGGLYEHGFGELPPELFALVEIREVREILVRLHQSNSER